ncbi:MAG: hypothetical protein HRT47_09705 [Candidatus Caenarcaniphilales bacterium]|nr:hypothetical protein [Candidatus Caenarcaniphilales bacterium]
MTGINPVLTTQVNTNTNTNSTLDQISQKTKFVLQANQQLKLDYEEFTNSTDDSNVISQGSQIYNSLVLSNEEASFVNQSGAYAKLRQSGLSEENAVETLQEALEKDYKEIMQSSNDPQTQATASKEYEAAKAALSKLEDIVTKNPGNADQVIFNEINKFVEKFDQAQSSGSMFNSIVALESSSNGNKAMALA